MEKNQVIAIVTAILLINKGPEKEEDHPTNVVKAMIEANAILHWADSHPDALEKTLDDGLNWDHMKDMAE